MDVKKRKFVTVYVIQNLSSSEKKSENPHTEREREIGEIMALRNMFRRTMATSARAVKYNAHGAPASVLR